MNTAENRTDFISQQLHTHFLDETCVPVLLVDVDNWNFDPEEFGPTAACGWAWPILADDDSIVVAICPPIIDATTGHLMDEHLIDYLGIIGFIVDRHITLMIGEPDRSPWDRHQTILDNINEDWPLALGLLQEIQIRATS